MKAAIAQKHRDANIELIESSGGAFEISHDGELIFSKKQTGRFPDHEEILAFLN